MLEDAVRILDANRLMAISTVRPDGWPQTTIVGYANDGVVLYFLIFRSGQKFANIQQNDRVSLAVAQEPGDLRDVQAVYAGAHAAEVTNPVERDRAWRLLEHRHPNLHHFAPPPKSEAAMMRAVCEHVSILDYSKGIGHTEALTVGAEQASTAINSASRAPKARRAPAR